MSCLSLSVPRDNVYMSVLRSLSLSLSSDKNVKSCPSLSQEIMFIGLYVRSVSLRPSPDKKREMVPRYLRFP